MVDVLEAAMLAFLNNYGVDAFRLTVQTAMEKYQAPNALNEARAGNLVYRLRMAQDDSLRLDCMLCKDPSQPITIPGGYYHPVNGGERLI